MNKFHAALALLAVLGLSTAEATDAKPAKGKAAKKPAFALRSPAFKHGTAIPAAHACGEQDRSPGLEWSDPPKGTASFALVLDDPDAPPGTWVHWVVYGIPGSARSLEEGLAKDPALPGGIKQGACWGVDRFARVGYHGPCPPPGKPHRYFFKLYALAAPPELPPDSSKLELERAMKGRVLGQAVLMGTYKR